MSRPLRRIARGVDLRIAERAYFADDFEAVNVPTEVPRTMEPHLAAVTRHATAEVDAAMQAAYLVHRDTVLTELEQQQLVAQAVTDVLERTLGRDSLVTAVVAVLQSSAHVRALDKLLQQRVSASVGSATALRSSLLRASAAKRMRPSAQPDILPKGRAYLFPCAAVRDPIFLIALLRLAPRFLVLDAQKETWWLDSTDAYDRHCRATRLVCFNGDTEVERYSLRWWTVPLAVKDWERMTTELLADRARAFPGWETVQHMLDYLHSLCAVDRVGSRAMCAFLARIGAPYQYEVQVQVAGELGITISNTAGVDEIGEAASTLCIESIGADSLALQHCPALRENDIVVEVNGLDVRDMDFSAALKTIVEATRPVSIVCEPAVLKK